MKIVFPTDENNGFLSKRGAHFGKAKYYTIVTLQEDTIVDVEGISNPGHNANGCSDAILNIMALAPDALVVSGIGGSPAAGFAKAGLDVFVDHESPTVQESITRLTRNMLQAINGQGTCSTH
jgi:predicted Fe-Mo cluster-binding NifX family protein